MDPQVKMIQSRDPCSHCRKNRGSWRRYARYSEVLQTCKYVCLYIYTHNYILVGGLEHVLFSIVYGIILPVDSIFFRVVETTNQYKIIYMYSRQIHPFVDSDKKALELAISHHISPHGTVVSPYPQKDEVEKKGGNPCFWFNWKI